jgi:SPP1 gp7 family putative phage head morphogenesis protein
VSSPTFGLAGTNPEAVAVAEESAAEMVTAITDEIMQAIRAVVVRSIRDGIPVYDSAKQVRDLVGMNAQQAQAAMNYRAELIQSGLSPEDVNTAMDKYVAKKIRQRALMIARTETMKALNDGSVSRWKQDQADGYLGPGATKEWMATEDEVTCPQCSTLDGIAVPLGEDFPDDGGEGPPAHPNCRCTLAVNP